MLPMTWRMVDKWLGCWAFCHDVGFVFKFGSNGSNFDVSTSFLVCGVVCAKGVRDGVGSDIPVAYVGWLGLEWWRDMVLKNE